MILRLLVLAVITVVLTVATVACTNIPNQDPYGYNSSLGLQESEKLANDLNGLKKALGPSHPQYQHVVQLSESANRHRDRMRRLKVYIVTLRAILDDQ